MSDYKTRQRVAKFASDGVDVAQLAESVTFEPMQEQEPRVIFISPLSGPVLASTAICMSAWAGSIVAYQKAMIDGPMFTLIVMGSFIAMVIVTGRHPELFKGSAKRIEIQPAQVAAVPADFEPDMDEVTRPHPHSMTIRFYEPPIRPSGVPVSWESICYACRQTLNGRPFSEREIAGPKGARISGPDFRILAGDFLRRGYTERSADGVTGFTPRGGIQVKKLAQLPY
jgi:hypothetical protein